MNCLEFERLLDAGEPERLPDAGVAHARGCARCARSWARARALERALERHFASTATDSIDRAGENVNAPAGIAGDETLPEFFTNRVMARVERIEARGVRWLMLGDAMPWWVRVPAEPTVALAAAVAALLLWRGDALLAAARAWSPDLTLASSLASGWWHRALSAPALAAPLRTLAHSFMPGQDAHWSVAVAMALGVTPLIALAAYGLWRMGERLACPPGDVAPR